MRSTATGNIFISYRREDSAAYAGRVCDHLAALFGADRVFMDVEDLSPGQNFVQTIDGAIASCDAVLAIIGPKWMDILQKRSQEAQPDYVCRELEAAIARHITIVPVLVGGATMAQLTGLPQKLQDLPLHEAAELRDSTFNEDCARLAKALTGQAGLKIPPVARRKLFVWIAAAAALMAVLVALAAIVGIGPGSEYRARKAATRRFLATARTQMDQAEYQPAFKTCQEALKADPGSLAAMDLQLDAAMLWLRDFHVLVGEGQKAEDIAGPPLGEIMSVLDAGLARTNGGGPRAADILAHLGWAHWLNQRLAYREFGPAAERALRRALGIEPSNVFANAMLGNWLLQTHGSVAEALRCFEVAVKTNRERPLVRKMQLGAMIYAHDDRMRSELAKVANQMRINGEPIGERDKGRILTSYNPGLNSYPELRAALSAVPANESWATYLWLDDRQVAGSEADEKRIRDEFIHAGILEIDGKAAEALAIFRGLERELKARGYSGRIVSHVAAAIARLSR